MYYCVDREDYARQYIEALMSTEPEEEEMSTPATETNLTLIPDSEGGVNYRGYDLTKSDVDKLMDIVNSTHRLDDAGFDVEINEVSVGCMKFTRSQLNDLYKEYVALKEHRDVGFTVKAGDRVEYTPAGDVYIVACIGRASYMLISLSDGNRWSEFRIVEDPKDRDNMPFVDFVGTDCELECWTKVE